jgi:hypothetical protein
MLFLAGLGHVRDRDQLKRIMQEPRVPAPLHTSPTVKPIAAPALASWVVLKVG